MSLTGLLSFKITKQFPGNEERVIAKFALAQDANEFMENKAVWDNKTKVIATYRLYEDDELAKELNSAQMDADGTPSDTSNYTTTSPFSTAPRPPGTLPPTRKKDDDDDDLE